MHANTNSNNNMTFLVKKLFLNIHFNKKSSSSSLKSTEFLSLSCYTSKKSYYFLDTVYSIYRRTCVTDGRGVTDIILNPFVS